MKTLARKIVVGLFLIILLPCNGNFTQARSSRDPDSSSQIALGEADHPWRSEYVLRSIVPPIDMGKFSSLVINPVDNRVYIGFYNYHEGELMYAYQSPDANCGSNNNWHCMQLTNSNDNVGLYASSDIWSQGDIWKLGISFYDLTHRSLKLMLETCFGTVCSYKFSTIDSPNDSTMYIGLHSSFKFYQDGIPILSYQILDSDGSDALMFAHGLPDDYGNCGEDLDAGFWQCDRVDSAEGIGQFASMDVSWNDNIYIAYHDPGSASLKYAMYHGPYGNCGDGNFWECTTVDDPVGATVGLYASMKAPPVEGAPIRIAYYDATNGHLKFFNSGAGITMVVDDMSISDAHRGISLDIDNDNLAVIAYQKIFDQVTPPVLSVARPYLAFDDGFYGNCGDVIAGNQYWRCNTIDYGAENILVGEFVSLAINSHGLARIAYTEEDQVNFTTGLKFIYQVNQTFLPLITKR